MIKYKQIQKIELQVEDVICDSCDNSCWNKNNFEYMTLSNSWGFGSKYDLETWPAQVCESCVDEKFKFINFKKESSRFIG